VDAAVVVDSRNIRGQYADVFGQPRRSSVSGIVTMLADYGFNVTDVYVGMGTNGSANGSVYLARRLQENRDYAAEIVSHPDGHVLEGRLVERSSKSGKVLEEKLVDVLCALQVARLAHEIKDKARSGVIIVLSEDMDLIPAYKFADDLGVTVFAASNDIVDARAQYSKWLLLTQAGLGDAAGRAFGRDQGRELRRSIARLLQATPPAKIKGKVASPCRDGVLVNHNSGAKGFWRPPAGKRVSTGTPVELYVAGVDWEDVAFPRMKLSEVAPTAPPMGLQVGKVTAIPTPTRVSVTLPGGVSKKLDGSSPGSLLPDMAVLVHAESVQGQQAWRLVGALDARPISPGWSDPTRPLVVRAVSTASTPGARVRAKILTTGQEVTLQPPSEDCVQTGYEYAAVPIAHTEVRDVVHVTAIAVSSRLR
jgi:hypothetical protein